MVSGKSAIAARVSAGLLLCPWLASAAEPAIDRAVESILNRPLVLEQPEGFEAPSTEQLRQFLDEEGIDIGKLAVEAERRKQELATTLGIAGATAADAPPAAARVLVFVSMSMPEQSLKRVVADAERAGALLVMNGMPGNSMRATRTAVQSINGEAKVGWQIDPVSLKRFEVKVAPTTVLAASPTRRSDCDDKREGACTDEAFWGFEGDVSLEYALAKIAAADAKAETLAAPFLARLRGERGER
jgi:type-F conjugative transfer system pilin assembly protein TrbC